MGPSVPRHEPHWCPLHGEQEHGCTQLWQWGEADGFHPRPSTTLLGSCKRVLPAPSFPLHSCPHDLLVWAGAGRILLYLCITSCSPAAGTVVICNRAGWKFTDKHIWGKIHLFAFNYLGRKQTEESIEMICLSTTIKHRGLWFASPGSCFPQELHSVLFCQTS